MSNTAKHIYIIAAFILALFIAYRVTEKAPVQVVSEPKVKEVEQIKPIAPVVNNYPTTVINQTLVDTTRRKQAEKEDIITGATVKPGEVDIQKISPEGKVTEEIHKTEEGSKLLITNKGVEEKKRTKAGKFLRKSGKVVLRTLEVIGVIAIAFIVAK